MDLLKLGVVTLKLRGEVTLKIRLKDHQNQGGRTLKLGIVPHKLERSKLKYGKWESLNQEETHLKLRRDNLKL